MASHDINLAAATSDRLVLLQSGNVAANGTPAQVLQPELFGAVYGVSMRRLDPLPGGIPLLHPEAMLQSD
jgi:iron complex transport system ATP-binding protein